LRHLLHEIGTAPNRNRLMSRYAYASYRDFIGAWTPLAASITSHFKARPAASRGMRGFVQAPDSEIVRMGGLHRCDAPALFDAG
jgi:hypothetical protein